MLLEGDVLWNWFVLILCHCSSNSASVLLYILPFACLQVLLIVNVASECGYTHTHYLDLVNLQSELEFTGLFHVLAFPCNQFGQQEPQVHSCQL